MKVGGEEGGVRAMEMQSESRPRLSTPTEESKAAWDMSKYISGRLMEGVYVCDFAHMI